MGGRVISRRRDCTTAYSRALQIEIRLEISKTCRAMFVVTIDVDQHIHSTSVTSVCVPDVRCPAGAAGVSASFSAPAS